MDFLEELEARILPGDGAMGTMLMDAGVPEGHCFEELSLSAPEQIARIHAEYIAAGARLIETNTFGANAAQLDRHGLADQTRAINLAAVSIAKAAAKGKQVYVAGSVGPLGITAEQAQERGIDRRTVFTGQIWALLEAEVDLLFMETFLDLEELSLALSAVRILSSIPVICSLACPPAGRLPCGVPVEEAFRTLRSNGADVVGVNCVTGPAGLQRLLEKIPAEGLVSAYPNAGYPKYQDGQFIYAMTPDYFASTARDFVAEGANLIGGCCGTRPEHIAALVAAVQDLRPATSKPLRTQRPSPPPSIPSRPAVTVESAASTTGLRMLPTVELPANPPPLPATAPAAAPQEEPSILDLVKTGKPVILAELDPPKTLELERYFAGARALTDAGADAITLADNSLAILRVSNMALAAMLKAEHGIRPLVHIACRDKNLLGLQSELMGLSALGIRHILPLTGDPAKVGDHPAAASVYDVNSIELMKIVSRLNEGVNHAGNSIKKATNFVMGGTFNPNARSLAPQIARLERKIAAGAQYVMTQPVFDPALVEATAKATRHLNIPIFIGVWPLLNGRQAEFLHNEVPGIVIPDHVRSQMAGLEGTEGRRAGVELAKEVTRAVLDCFPGAYLITPFLAYETTAELANFVRSR